MLVNIAAISRNRYIFFCIFTRIGNYRYDTVLYYLVNYYIIRSESYMFGVDFISTYIQLAMRICIRVRYIYWDIRSFILKIILFDFVYYLIYIIGPILNR